MVQLNQTINVFLCYRVTRIEARNLIGKMGRLRYNELKEAASRLRDLLDDRSYESAVVAGISRFDSMLCDHGRMV